MQSLEDLVRESGGILVFCADTFPFTRDRTFRKDCAGLSGRLSKCAISPCCSDWFSCAFNTSSGARMFGEMPLRVDRTSPSDHFCREFGPPRPWSTSALKHAEASQSINVEDLFRNVEDRERRVSTASSYFSQIFICFHKYMEMQEERSRVKEM